MSNTKKPFWYRLKQDDEDMGIEDSTQLLDIIPLDERRNITIRINQSNDQSDVKMQKQTLISLYLFTQILCVASFFECDTNVSDNCCMKFFSYEILMHFTMMPIFLEHLGFRVDHPSIFEHENYNVLGI